MTPATFEIKAGTRAWGDYRVVVLGSGATVNEALSDASKLVGSSFRPKQDGRQGIQLNVTIERPDGTRFNITPERLKLAIDSQDLEDAKEIG
jgi:hypothetical protein